jgi:hypothetical protein
MKQFSKAEIKLLSFPDADVKEFTVNVSKKFFSVKCGDGYLDEKEGGHVIHAVELQIQGFESLEIKEFANEKLTLVEIYTNDFALKDICEFTVENNSISLKGFSKLRGYWTEYLFSGGELSGHYHS